jgi:hypothetical protein
VKLILFDRHTRKSVILQRDGAPPYWGRIARASPVTTL